MADFELQATTFEVTVWRNRKAEVREVPCGPSTKCPELVLRALDRFRDILSEALAKRPDLRSASSWKLVLLDEKRRVLASLYGDPSAAPAALQAASPTFPAGEHLRLTYVAAHRPRRSLSTG